ncbi:BTB/POZ domain-containing protein [Nymphaea thermarum]|nr:BTB/POZ domain-containing protein [Nymphaea thermarum]
MGPHHGREKQRQREEPNQNKEKMPLKKFGDRPSSDVVVRLRTKNGRDDWFYCHTHIITRECQYFAERLSDNWPTLQIIDSRNCVDVYCDESEVDHYVNFLRLLYNPNTSENTLYGVISTLGILQVAIVLGSKRIACDCVEYLEAVPWEEAEEEEILRVLPKLGPQAEPILARLQPVDSAAIHKVFVAALHLATAFLPSPMDQPKTTVQEQLEYMLTEDDDAPLLTADEHIKDEVRKCLQSLFSRLEEDIEKSSLHPLEEERETRFIKTLSDLSWICSILPRLDLMKHFAETWLNISNKIVEATGIMKGSEPGVLELKLKVTEVMAKVVEAVGYGVAVLPVDKRLDLVHIWLPFVRKTKPELERSEKVGSRFRMREELCETIESAFVTLVLALPSPSQANILTEWLNTEESKFPDLSEAFEVWCYRSKAAKRKLSLGSSFATTSTS